MKWYLGIDVSKGYADFVLLSENLEKMEETFQLDDTRSGHEKLKSWLESVFKKHPGLQIDSAVESTGGFENNWYLLIVGLGSKLAIRVARLNPSVVKNASKALLNANKTDAESARDIASYLKRFDDQVDYTCPESQYSAFRSLDNHLQLVTKQKTQVINELKQLLYSSFPELQRFCKQSIPNWVLDILQRYPSPSKLAKIKPEKLSKVKGVTLEKAEKLIEKAKASVSSRDTLTDEFLITSMAADIAQKQHTVKKLKAYLAENCKGRETELLESIIGIGAYSAAAMMIQIEDVKRFASPKELASYFGLHPLIKISGDKKMESRMSKQGRPAIRAILFMCANSAVLADPHMRSIYARHRAKGKSHKHTIGIIMHKMIRVIWGVLHHQQPYDSKVDAINQQKNLEQPVHAEIKETKSKRRIQDFDNEAPISRIASKKRKVHATSQAGDAGQVRDLVHEPDR
jgi:transposase